MRTMEIMRSSAPQSVTFYNCRIETGGSLRYGVGERVLFDDGNVIVGPLKIVGHESRNIIVTADDDYAIYNRIDADKVAIEDLRPIVDCYYEPVTSNIFLDGFLGAAYQDNTGIVRVDIEPTLPGLKDYYVKLMDENGIEYRVAEDGFIFPDQSIIDEIFKKQEDVMPPKYVIGFLSSFIVKSRVRIGNNPSYERYIFILPSTEEYYEGMAPKGLYYYLFHGQCAIFSIFGSFEPLAHYIDSIDSAMDEPVFREAIHMDDIFFEVAPKIIVKSLSIAGCNPSLLKAEDSITYCSVTLKDSDCSNRVVIAISTKDVEPEEYADYVIVFDGRRPKLRRLTNRGDRVEVDLLYSSFFNNSRELRDYLKIIFDKM